MRIIGLTWSSSAREFSGYDAIMSSCVLLSYQLGYLFCKLHIYLPTLGDVSVVRQASKYDLFFSLLDAYGRVLFERGSEGVSPATHSRLLDTFLDVKVLFLNKTHGAEQSVKHNQNALNNERAQVSRWTRHRMSDPLLSVTCGACSYPRQSSKTWHKCLSAVRKRILEIIMAVSEAWRGT